MAGDEKNEPWWERRAATPGEPQYEPQREHLRAELARAWRADVNVVALRANRGWARPEGPRAA